MLEYNILFEGSDALVDDDYVQGIFESIFFEVVSIKKLKLHPERYISPIRKRMGIVGSTFYIRIERLSWVRRNGYFLH